MRLRSVAVVGVTAVALTAAVVVRRRRGAPPAHPAQLGHGDGTIVHLGEDDPRLAPLRARATELRIALEAAS